MEITRAEMAEKLKHIRQARIYFHKKPDGDAVGAAYGLALGLQAHGIPCELRCSDPVPAAYRWMTDQVPTCALEQPTEIAVDTAAPGRLGRYKDQPMDLCIDHHEGNTIQAAYKYVVPEASSCSELIFWLLRDMGTVITPEIASLLYTGLVTDTSSFRSRSTNAASLKAAAELAACGAPVAHLARQYTLYKTPQRMEIERVLTNSFHYTCGGRILGCFFSYPDMVRIHTNDSELEGLNVIVEQVEGVEIGIVVRETAPNHCRVSVRTGGAYDAAAICAYLGGGGHAHAAGCELEGKPADVLTRVEAVCAQQITVV